MKSTYFTPAAAHRGDVVTMTLRGKIQGAETGSFGNPAAGCGLSFGL